MKKLLFLFAITFTTLQSFAQPNLPKNIADSLWQVWQDENQPDTTRLKAIDDYAWDGYLFTQPDSAFYYAQLEYDFAKAKGLKRQMASALNMQGVSFYFKGDYVNAIDFHTRGLKIREEIKDKKGIASSFNNIGNIYKDQDDYANAIDYYTRSLKIQEEIEDKKGIASSFNNIGSIYKDQGDYANAIDYSIRTLKVYEEIGDKNGIATSLNNIGIIYTNQGNYANAINYYTRSLKIQEEIGNKQGIAGSLNNIGTIYYYQVDYANAIDYYTRSLKIEEEIGNKKGIANLLNNIGSIYAVQGANAKAIDYQTRSLKIREEIGDKNGIAASFISIGNTCARQGGYTNALDYYTRSLKIQEEIGDKKGISMSLNNIGSIYKDQGDYIKALDYGRRSIQLAQEVGAVIETQAAAKLLWVVNKKSGNYKQSLEMHELYIQLRDSILSEENEKEVIRQEYKYNYEKKATADSVAFAKETEIKNIEIDKQKAEIKAKRNQQYALFGGLFLVVVFAGFMYNRFKVTQKQKTIIEEKERETHAQKEIIEEKHREITDSINYAERIQRSFLATNEMLDHQLKQYFVFFRPKDVVSGDFYWAGELNNGNFAFSCADSTGHGVPGAIMSILNISSLEKSIEKETEADKILNQTRRIIIDRLKKDGSEEGGKDGMDCSLLVLDKERKQLSFAAANNPVFILRPTVIASGAKQSKDVRNDDYELIEFKPDKMPVGKHDNDTESFTLQTAQLQKGDVIYTLTDGFPDQFGGDKGKKYMIKNLKTLLLQIAHLPMPEQEQQLAEEFEAWKGKNEQVDDVCIIGVRV